ncbi:MAG: efflux transporter outer membrane subunit [Pseudomonadota bacterium]|nr:efflux transporter outer membrane subunit [Pseudomonadota bacterium]
MPPSLLRISATLTAATMLASCVVGPTYERATAPTADKYKASEGWVDAEPADTLDRGPWWTRFEDPVLNDLVSRIEVSNQNVAAATAAYAQARALVREQRSSLFPLVVLDGGASRSGTGIGGDSQAGSTYRVSIGAGWEPDVWGRLRRSVEAASASAQASAADLAAALLSAQGELAANYFGLRQTDAQIALLADTISGYQRSLQITQNRYDAGIIARTDVLQAQTQLANTQGDAVGLRRQRAQFENAIAVLVGQSPSGFTLASNQWRVSVPSVPIGIPSTLLQRRPDIAVAERQVAAANEQIGIAQAAFYPSFNLTGSVGFGAARIAELVSASAALWSLGVSAAQVLFNAGATRARVDGTQAAHQITIARYRQTVLAAFEEVENLLTATRILEQQEVLRRQASVAADQVAAQVENRYRAGQINFTEVIIAQATALNARRALVQLLAERQTTAVALIQALGGGWQAQY